MHVFVHRHSFFQDIISIHLYSNSINSDNFNFIKSVFTICLTTGQREKGGGYFAGAHFFPYSKNKKKYRGQ